MEDLLLKLGGIAGVGGIALGIFYFLFKKIDLPKATRKQLTLFMWLVWSVAMAGMVAYVLNNYLSKGPDIDDKQTHARWEKPIPITYRDRKFEEEFFTFLGDNDKKIVYISSYLDLSVSVATQQIIAYRIGGQPPLGPYEKALDELTPEQKDELLSMCVKDFPDHDHYAFDKDHSTLLPLEGNEGNHFLSLHLLEHHKLTSSSGGTGIVGYDLTGYFRVSFVAHNNLHFVFHLTEVPATVTIDG